MVWVVAVLAKIKNLFVHWWQRKKWQRQLTNTCAYFDKKAIPFFEASFVQKKCPGCDCETEKMVSVGGYWVSDILYYADLIEKGWQCPCGYRVKPYRERFMLGAPR